MTTRGGQQRIPRPPGAVAGPPPPWAHLTPPDLRFGLDAVRSGLAVPTDRPPTSAAFDRRDAAVLVALFEQDGEARVVLTKRPETMPSHQGEIAFPGGKFEPEVDASLTETALREAHEEVALEPGSVEIITELDALSTMASRFVITPFVGLVAEPPSLVPHPREVVKVFDVALSELLSPETHRSEVWPVRDGRGSLVIHFYELEGETVWGFTARVLTNLLTTLTAPR